MDEKRLLRLAVLNEKAGNIGRRYGETDGVQDYFDMAGLMLAAIKETPEHRQRRIDYAFNRTGFDPAIMPEDNTRGQVKLTEDG